MDIETYLSGFDKAEKIYKGMAGDAKYRCRRGREEYLLRVADGEDFAEKKNEFEHLKRLSEAGLPVPKCVELVKNDDGSKVFTLLSWVTGEDLEGVISIMSASEQYDLSQPGAALSAEPGLACSFVSAVRTEFIFCFRDVILHPESGH